MNMKRFLSLVLCMCMCLTILAPAASSVEWKRTIRENVLFEKLDKSLLNLDLFGNLKDSDLKVEQIADDEIVQIFIIMDGLSVVESDGKAVYNAQTQAQMDELTAQQNVVIRRIEQTLLGGESLDVHYSYTWLLNGIATHVPYGMVSKIQAVAGVKQVLLQPQYEACTVQRNDTAELMTATGGSMIGRESVWSDGYTGRGTKIAVIDTGLDVDHQNFAALPEEALAENATSEATLAPLLAQLNASSRYKGLTAADVYQNTKVVFTFNYADDIPDVSHDNDVQGDHGTHVAGIATANKVDGSDVAGVAPDAQLYVMKVFGATRGGVAEDILAALEDALMLGVDVINMSLGNVAGFTSSTEEVNAIYDRVAQTNSVLCVAAGNNYTAGFGNNWGNDMNQTMHPDNSVMSSPALYRNVMSVASVNNSHIRRRYIQAGERKLAFIETSEMFGLPSVTGLQGEYPLVAIPGFGAAEDFEGLDLTGKIALIQRGTVSFGEKVQNAQNAGAVACLVYNNAYGEFGMDLTDCTATIPCVSVTMEDGEYLLAASQEPSGMVISFPDDTAAILSLLGYQVSDFSSWGVAPNLRLEPDITAPGGNIYSTINNGEYGLMSGTSMATPNMAGLSALVIQHLRQNTPDVDMPVRELVQYLLMSSAAPLAYDAETGLYYTPRQQGSGLANAYHAIHTQVYLAVEGVDSPKAELYDDPQRTGSYSFTFQVVNFGTVAAYYRLSTVAQTEDYTTDENHPDRYFMAGTPKALDAQTGESSANMVRIYDINEDGVTNAYDAYLIYLKTQPADASADPAYLNESFRYDLNSDEEVNKDDVQAYLNALVGLDSPADLTEEALKVEAGTTAEVSVTVELEQTDKDYLDTYFVNGGYVEGFTFLDALHREGVNLSLPYLAFYGSWDEAAVLDDGFYWDYLNAEEVGDEEESDEEGEEGEDDDFNDDELEDDAAENIVVGNQYVNVLWTQFYGTESYFYPGYNPYVTEEFDTSHISISPNGDGFIDTVDDIYISLMRNAKSLTFRYINIDTGEVYYDYTVGDISKSVYNQAYGQIIPAVYSWYLGEIPEYEFTDSKGKILANNTRLMLQVEASIEYEDARKDMWEVPVTIDLEAPELLNLTRVTQPDGTVLLELTFRDNLSVAAVGLLNSDGKEIYHMDGVEDPEPDANGYRTYTKTYDITDLKGKLTIMVADYALNESYYGLNLGGTGVDYGNLVGYQFNFGEELYGWVSFSEGVNRDEVHINLDEMDFISAEYINGFIYAQTESGALYGFRYEDMLADEFDLASTYITHLENAYIDFVYNYVDGELYGLLSSEYDGYPTTELYSINIHGYCYDENGAVTRTPYEETWAYSRGGLYALSVAADENGIFYLLGVNDKDKTELWISYKNGSYGTLFKKHMTLDLPMDYAQSMTYDHNTGTLYWAQFYPTTMVSYETGLYVIDVEAKTYKQVGTLSGETCAMFAPLKQDTIQSNPVYSNIPNMDPDEVGKPVLRKKVINMNVGYQETLFFDMTPWYTDHKDVVWSSSDPTVASVDENGTVESLRKGTVVITVAAKDDPTLFDTCTVNVTELSVEIEGIFSSMGAGVGNAGGSMLYKYTLDKGNPMFTQSHLITAPEEFYFGLDIATSVYARGYIWACEYGNTGMIYQIDPETGEVVDVLMPMDGDMLFGMTYNEDLDTFTAIMNMYLFVDLELTHEEEQWELDSYDEEQNAFMYHRIDMLKYLKLAGGNFMTGETGQGASSEVVMCGITNMPGGYQYQSNGYDFLGNYTADNMKYTASQTLVILDNVGRLWYIDEICGLKRSATSWSVTYEDPNDPNTVISYYNGSMREGLIEMENRDGTFNLFHIRCIEESPLTDMFRDGTMPRITYHFSDIEFGGYTEEGAPIFALSLYDYWNNGTTNELYLYVPSLKNFDRETESYVPYTEEILYYMGNTGELNVIASIHSFRILDGLEN